MLIFLLHDLKTDNKETTPEILLKPFMLTCHIIEELWTKALFSICLLWRYNFYLFLFPFPANIYNVSLVPILLITLFSSVPIIDFEQCW